LNFGPFLKTEVGFFGVLLAVTAIGGKLNLDRQLEIVGEYNNSPMEEMLEFIKAQTNPDSVFGGPMPTMARCAPIGVRRGVSKGVEDGSRPPALQVDHP
jgi:hypothetical protein